MEIGAQTTRRIAQRSLVIVRTPLRLSFVGGGSDLPGGHGAVVSSTIDKHVYCAAKRRRDGLIYLHWSEGREIVKDPKELRHEIAREVILESGLDGGVELVTFADVPAAGSGLGSSAATCIAMLHSLLVLRGADDSILSREMLARLAYSIQVDRLGRHQGAQDEYACAVGGWNKLEFFQNSSNVNVLPVNPGNSALEEAHDIFLLFSPRETSGRASESILSGFKETDDFRQKCIHLARLFVAAVNARNWHDAARSIGDHHRLKNEAFGGYMPEDLSSAASSAEFNCSWKLCGAGKTGHVLVACERQCRRAAIQTFEKAWGPQLPFKLVPYGSQVIYEEG